MKDEWLKMAEVWWSFLIKNKSFWCNGFTLKRLEKVKPEILKDKDIMLDLLFRHDGRKFTPEQLKEKDPSFFYHCVMNLSTATKYKMMDLGIIKIKESCDAKK